MLQNRHVYLHEFVQAKTLKNTGRDKVRHVVSNRKVGYHMLDRLGWDVARDAACLWPFWVKRRRAFLTPPTHPCMLWLIFNLPRNGG